MAIFDNVLFEGQQADEYKARKEKEKADKEAAETARNKRRYGEDDYSGPGNKSKDTSSWKNTKKDLERSNKAGNMVSRETNRRIEKSIDDLNSGSGYSSDDTFRVIDNRRVAKDAANRHLRRHGSKNESVGIFESVELI